MPSASTKIRCPSSDRRTHGASAATAIDCKQSGEKRPGGHDILAILILKCLCRETLRDRALMHWVDVFDINIGVVDRDDAHAREFVRFLILRLPDGVTQFTVGWIVATVVIGYF